MPPSPLSGSMFSLISHHQINTTKIVFTVTTDEDYCLNAMQPY